MIFLKLNKDVVVIINNKIATRKTENKWKEKIWRVKKQILEMYWKFLMI